MSATRHAYQFGPFSLLPASRLLLAHGQPVRLGARALDILIALVEQPGQVVDKDDLLRRVWPDTIVEEASLRVHIAALRKALGGSDARYIANIPGKGYSFTAEVAQVGAAPASGVVPLRLARHNLPVRLTRMIGRDAATNDVSALLRTRRFVTVAGEGGVGKTTLALAVAEGTLDEYPDGTAFVDLALCACPSAIVDTVGHALGVPLPQSSAAEALMPLLQGRRMLLVMDNCEHLVASAADLIAHLLRAFPALHVLATSREPLRADGEHVHRVEPLRVPPASVAVSLDEAIGYESIQLLVERVSAHADGFELCEADVPHAAELCRRLDGIPLAIELAAARVSFFGMAGLLERLHDRLRILTSGHRTVLPRHQTLRALYDWSFDLLDEDAKRLFTGLSVFPGLFSLEDALALVPGDDRGAALAVFIDLIAKSLVAPDIGGDRRQYRLLDTARVYAQDKLSAFGGTDGTDGARAPAQASAQAPGQGLGQAPVQASAAACVDARSNALARTVSAF